MTDYFFDEYLARKLIRKHKENRPRDEEVYYQSLGTSSKRRDFSFWPKRQTVKF